MNIVSLKIQLDIHHHHTQLNSTILKKYTVTLLIQQNYKGNIMAVPKSKISNSRRGMRRAHQSLSNAKIVEDKDSGEMRLSHNIDMRDIPELLQTQCTVDKIGKN